MRFLLIGLLVLGCSGHPQASETEINQGEVIYQDSYTRLIVIKRPDGYTCTLKQYRNLNDSWGTGDITCAYPYVSPSP